MSHAAYPTESDLALFLRRAGLLPQGTGSLASSSTNLTGTGTIFLTEAEPGNWLLSQGQAKKVNAAASNTAATTTAAFSPALPAGSPFWYTTLDLTTAINAGIRAFESAVGFPMLAGSEETRSVDPRVSGNGTLILPWPVATLVGVAWQSQSDPTETEWTEGTHYVASPQNATAQGVPITDLILSGFYDAMRFDSLRWDQWTGVEGIGAVKITGKFGYGLVIPDDAWQAMLQLAAGSLMGAVNRAKFEGVKSWRDSEGRSITYDTEGTANGWKTEADEVINLYKYGRKFN